MLLITFATLISTFIGKYISSLVFMSINKNMHMKVIKSLIETRMEFFDQYTSSYIINRVSQDVAHVDIIVFNFLEMIDYIIKCTFSIIFIIMSSPITIFVVLI